MTHALYNKYRPRSLSRVIGHKVAVEAMTKAIESGKVPSYILLLGPTSVGKSTLAGAFAADVLGTKDFRATPNFSEYNLSEDRSIEGVRGIIRESKLSPRGASRRIILLEEAQGILGNAPAANAFLSALEHPPESTTFIVCSMEASKFSASTLGKAFQNRASMKFNLAAPGKAELLLQAKRIRRGEGADFLTDEHLDYVAENCNSEMRSLASALEIAINLHGARGSLTLDELKEAVNVASSSSDDAAVEQFIYGCLSGSFQRAQLALLEVTDPVSVAMKICSTVTFVLNMLVLDGKKSSKVWGSTSGWNVLKKLKAQKNLDKDSMVEDLAELNSRLVTFRVQAGAFAVNEQLALSAIAWQYIKRSK